MQPELVVALGVNLKRSNGQPEPRKPLIRCKVGGSLWKPNQRVIVFDPVLGFNNQELVISEVVYTQDEGGTRCELRVAPEAAYIPPLEELKVLTAEEDW